MNEATHYTIYINDIKEDLPKTLFSTLGDLLQSDNVNPDIFDRYLKEGGEIQLCRQSGKQEAAWLEKISSKIYRIMGGLVTTLL